jgi:hypothetical protein
MSANSVPLESLLAPFAEALAADGYSARVTDSPIEVVVDIIAGPDACAECLIPRDLMSTMIRELFGAHLGPERRLRLSYPEDG